jgi:hypothetical protein
MIRAIMTPESWQDRNARQFRMLAVIMMAWIAWAVELVLRPVATETKSAGAAEADLDGRTPAKK